jgi:thiaminase/transcriptional activator TenA
MAVPGPVFGAPGGLFQALRAGASTDWQAYIWHPFVQGLADGSLPAAAFRRYLVQDYLFLVQFCRAFALAAYKTDSFSAFRERIAAISGLLHETTMHLAYCRDWGLTEAEVLAAPEAPATTAYTRWVLDRGIAGDILDLEVALAPCTVGYGEIARLIEASPTRQRAGNPYESWIAMYAGAEYQALAAGAAARLDALGQSHGGTARLPALTAHFAKAARLEADFWAMGLGA